MENHVRLELGFNSSGAAEKKVKVKEKVKPTPGQESERAKTGHAHWMGGWHYSCHYQSA